jgi:hypothetical protein
MAAYAGLQEQAERGTYHCCARVAADTKHARDTAAGVTNKL